MRRTRDRRLRAPGAGRGRLSGAVRPARRGRILRAGLFGALAVVALGSPARTARADAGLYPLAGVTWVQPLDAGVRNLYSGGLGFSGALGYSLPPWSLPARLRIEARGGWYRSSAHPASLLASGSSSRLTLIPVSLEAQARFPGHSALVPIVLAGPAAVYAQERFDLALLSNTTQSSGSVTDWGAVLGLGLGTESGRFGFNLVGRAVLTGGHRQVLRADGRSDARTSPARASLFTVGLEVLLH